MNVDKHRSENKPRTPEECIAHRMDAKRREIEGRYDYLLRELGGEIGHELLEAGCPTVHPSRWPMHPWVTLRYAGYLPVCCEATVYGWNEEGAVIWHYSVGRRPGRRRHAHFADALMAAQRRPGWLARLFGRSPLKPLPDIPVVPPIPPTFARGAGRNPRPSPRCAPPVSRIKP
jgi:hypothetical protein